MEKLGKRVDVVVRNSFELAAVLRTNPFPHADPAKVGVFFRSDPLDKSLLANLAAPGGEEVQQGKREIYIHFPHGMGRSKLKLPAGVGTVRNVNTIARLVDLARAE
jgi:uncharacterized protein (DUF1697 family)